MQNQQTIPRWLYTLTPCTISALFFAFAIMDSYADLDASQGWSFTVVIYSMPPLVAVIILDVILRLTLRNKFGLIWLVEGIIVMIIFLLLLNLNGTI